MRRVLTAAILVFSIPAFCAVPAKAATAAKASTEPSLTVPAYPGATPVMEISIAERDILNWVKQVLPALATMSAGQNEGLLGRISKLDLEGLAKALQGLKQVKVLEFALPRKAGTSAQKVVDYYTAQLEKETGWTRVFWRSDDPQKSLAVYSLPDADGVFITSVKMGQRGGKLLVGRTSGRVDLGKVIEWAAKNLEPMAGIAQTK